MFKYVELCIELKKGARERPRPVQDRASKSMNRSRRSLHFLKLATEKAESAQAAAAASASDAARGR